MKKSLLVLGCLILTINLVNAQSISMDDVNLKGAGISSVEIYYERTDDNQTVFNDFGIRAEGHIYDPCVKRKRNGATGDCRVEGDSVEYMRFGAVAIDIGVFYDAGEVGAVIEAASIAYLEAENTNGTSVHYLRVSYQSEIRTRYIDYRIPVELVGVGHEATINIVGDKLQILISGSIGLSAGIAKVNNLEMYQRKTDKSNYEYVDLSAYQLDLGIDAEASAGLRILKVFDITALGNASPHTTGSTYEYGANASLTLPGIGFMQNFRVSGYFLRGTMGNMLLDTNNNMRILDAETGDQVKSFDQKYHQGGVTVGFDF